MTAPTSETPLKVVPPNTDDAAQLAPPAVDADPDPEVLDPEPEVIDPDVEDATSGDLVPVSAAVANIDRFDAKIENPKWPYEWLEFKGDQLAVRVPTRTALAGFSLASSKYVGDGMKTDLSSFFIAKHLSNESYGRVFSRMMDPDEKDYTMETVGELFNEIVGMALTDEEKAEIKANADA